MHHIIKQCHISYLSSSPIFVKRAYTKKLLPTADFCGMITSHADCSPMELWNVPAANVTFLPNVSLLSDTIARYPTCDAEGVGSAALVDARLNTFTVVYYTGITPGSKACFVCDGNSLYELNTTTNERVCQSDTTWSGSTSICGRLIIVIRTFAGYSPA